MYDKGRYCIDILDQLAAASAAVDATSLLILERHIRACLRDAIQHDDGDAKVAELLASMRRYLRKH